MQHPNDLFQFDLEISSVLLMAKIQLSSYLRSGRMWSEYVGLERHGFDQTGFLEIPPAPPNTWHKT